MNITRKTRWLGLLLWLAVSTTSYGFYNPATGRWLSRDPIGEAGGANLNAFVDNDALSYIDIAGDQKAGGAVGKPAAPKPQPPNPSVKKLGLKPKVFKPPQPGPCGKVLFSIWWEIENATFNTLGGHVVQQITITWDIKDRDGNDVAPRELDTDKVKSPNKYWEAWHVAKHALNPSMVDGKQDNFEWVNEGCTKGTVKWSASAAFYHGLLALPGDMVEWNEATLAGGLPSTTNDPKFNGGTAPVDHSLEITWDCVKSPGSYTKVKAHSP